MCDYSNVKKTVKTLEKSKKNVVFTVADVKELSLCHKLKFANPYICPTW